jgi:hypothetical protein
MSLPSENDREESVSENPREEVIDQDTERVLFLKAFAEDTTKSYKVYAREFNIPDNEAYDYVKKFVWLMIHTWNEDDGPEKVASVLNDGVKSKLDQITIQEVEALKPLMKKYGRYEIVEPPKKVKTQIDVKKNQTVNAKMTVPDFNTNTNQPIPNYVQQQGTIPSDSGYLPKNNSPTLGNPVANILVSYGSKHNAQRLFWRSERTDCF